MKVDLNGVVHSITATAVGGNKNECINPAHEAGGECALGVWQPQHRFDYGLVVGGFNTQRFLKLINWQASIAAEHLLDTGQLTVIVLDNASFHKSKALREHWQSWQEQGLFLFFVPPHSPQMNRIEDEWLHLKRFGVVSEGV